jgi:hypothetical protein
MDFDPAEFESFKASSAPAAGGFDPKEFESFKSGKKDAKGGFAWSDAVTDGGGSAWSGQGRAFSRDWYGQVHRRSYDGKP